MLGGDFYYAVVLQPGTPGLPGFSDAVVRRINCLKMISGLPADAFEEANEALSDISRFYELRQRGARPLALTGLPHDVHRSVEADIDRVYDREVFYLSEG